MAKKKRKYNTNLIKQRHSYTIAEIAQIYRVHIRAVQSWIRQDLQVLDTNSKPYLIYGTDIRQFLKQRADKRKHPISDNEFFCPKCKLARKSIKNSIRFEVTKKKLGKHNKLTFIRGTCEICGSRLIRFTSDKKLEETLKKLVPSEEFETLLSGNRYASMNTDIEGGSK